MFSLDVSWLWLLLFKCSTGINCLKIMCYFCCPRRSHNRKPGVALNSAHGNSMSSHFFFIHVRILLTDMIRQYLKTGHNHFPTSYLHAGMKEGYSVSTLSCPCSPERSRIWSLHPSENRSISRFTFNSSVKIYSKIAGGGRILVRYSSSDKCNAGGGQNARFPVRCTK